MKEAVCFSKSINPDFFIAYGQMYDIGWICYIKGKELGYKDVYVEWQKRNAFLWDDNNNCISGIKRPRNKILPVKFVDENSDINECDKIYIDSKDIFWNGCPPLIESKRTWLGNIIYTYFNLYKYQHKQNPYYEIENHNEKYVVIHYRHSNKSSQQHRNIDEKYYILLIKHIKEFYPDFEIWKMGEPSRFDSSVDKQIPYFLANQDELYRIISNSSLFIGSDCGPQSISKSMNKPTLILCTEYKDTMMNWKKRKVDYGFDYLNDDAYYYENQNIHLNLDVHEPNVINESTEFIDEILKE